METHHSTSLKRIDCILSLVAALVHRASRKARVPRGTGRLEVLLREDHVVGEELWPRGLAFLVD